MKIWCTKWALTQGIEEFEAEICKDVSTDMVRVGSGVGRFILHGEGKEWHRTEKGAKDRVIVMIDKKIVSLRKEEKKLVDYYKSLFKE